MGGILTTVYIRIGAFLAIISPTTLCVCHSGFLIVSEYFPDDWCIKKILKIFNQQYSLVGMSLGLFMQLLPITHLRLNSSTTLLDLNSNHNHLALLMPSCITWQGKLVRASS